MLTIPYRDYSPQETQKRAIGPTSVQGYGGVVFYSGPSLFDVPDSVDFEILPDDVLIIQFGYPNNEPSESVPRELSKDGLVTATLARHTKKILSLRLPQASTRLFDDGLRIDTSGIHGWIEDLPAEAFNACVRNTEIVASILRLLPRDFRKHIARHLKSPTSPE